MKKVLASTLAILMTAAMLTACGDTESSSTAASTAETTTTTAAEATEDEVSEEAAEESVADKTADDETDDETGDDSSDSDEAAEPRDISEVGDDLKYYDEASLKFTTDMDISFASMFNEEVGGKLPGEDGYTGDEGVLELSVEELGGIPMLKVNNLSYEEDGETYYNGVKLRFDMDKLFEGNEELLNNIFTVKAEVIFVANDEWYNESDGESYLVPGWFGGAFGTNNGEDWNGNMLEYSDGEYTSTWRYTELTIHPGIFEDLDGNPTTAQFGTFNDTNSLTLMQWGVTHDIDIYIADIVFEDEDGNVIELP